MCGYIGETVLRTGRLPDFLLFTLAAWLVLIGGTACSRPTANDDVHSVTIETEDGHVIAVTAYTPREVQPPGILLVHRYGGNRGVWEHTARVLQQEGVLSVVVDLRGHGESRQHHENTVHYRELPRDAWLEALADVRAAKSVLLEMGADPDNLAVAGEGLGAGLALHYALEDPSMQAVIMLSPGLETQGVKTERAITRLTDCPTLLMASDGDAYASMSANALSDAAPVYSELRMWPGAAHGVDIFDVQPEAIRFMTEWLSRIIGQKNS